MTDRELILAAIEARKNAYTPYSHFQVGAALLAENGRVYTGCNVENAGYTPTNCAERTAFSRLSAKGRDGLPPLPLSPHRKGNRCARLPPVASVDR